MLDRLFGYTLREGWKSAREEASTIYEKSARVATILGRGALSLDNRIDERNYILLHRDYVHPRFVLENDRATLQAVTLAHAIFCVTAPGVDVNDTRVTLSEYLPFEFNIRMKGVSRLIRSCS